MPRPNRIPSNRLVQSPTDAGKALRPPLRRGVRITALAIVPESRCVDRYCCVVHMAAGRRCPWARVHAGVFVITLAVLGFSTRHMTHGTRTSANAAPSSSDTLTSTPHYAETSRRLGARSPFNRPVRLA